MIVDGRDSPWTSGYTYLTVHCLSHVYGVASALGIAEGDRRGSPLRMISELPHNAYEPKRTLLSAYRSCLRVPCLDLPYL